MQNCEHELWVLIGPNWKMPIHVQWFDVVAKIEPGAGLPLLKIQQSTMRAALAEIADREESGSFFVFRNVLERYACQAETDNPEKLVEWLPSRAEKVNSDYRPNKFILGYVQSEYAVERDPILADLMWESFCKWMLHWLMVEQEPVDIRFAELVPLQVRRNWAQVLAKMENDKIPDRMRYLPGVNQMIKRGVHRLALSDYLIAWAERYCDWTIEVRTNREWDVMVERTERERMRKRGTHYYRDIAEQMKRQLPDLILCYEQYLEKASQPAIQLFKGIRNSRTGNMENRVCGTPIPPHSPHLPRYNLCADPDAKGPFTDVVSEDEILRSLPFIQPGAADLRNGFVGDGSGI